MKKRLLYLLLCLCLVLAAAPFAVMAEETAITPWDGTTVDTNWYNETDTEFTITTAAQLAGLAKLVNNRNFFSGKAVTLGADIDLAGKSWTPIGIGLGSFLGTFDGAGYTISNLTVGGNMQFAGLFGTINTNGTVKNLTLTGVAIEVSYDNSEIYVGGITGENSGTIENCSVSGAVQGTSSKSTVSVSVGGIAGFNRNGDGILNCTNTATVTAESDYLTRAGGITGSNYSSTVDNCHNTGAVTATGGSNSANAGGVIGFDDYGIVKNCSNTGKITASAEGGGEAASANNPNVYAGGIDGRSSGSTVSNCYNTGNISSTLTKSNAAACSGGITGYIENGAVYNCYSIGDIISTATGDGSPSACVGGIAGGFFTSSNLNKVSGYYLANSTIKPTAASSDYEFIYKDGCTAISDKKELLNSLNAWVNAQRYGNYLSWESDDATNNGYPVFAAPSNWTGTGIETDPYVISDVAGLVELADRVNAGETFAGAYFKLGADIDLANKPWYGIGVYNETTIGTAFQGTFDGNNKTVSGVTFANTGSNTYRGFFNQLYKATVKDLTVECNGFESTTTGKYGGAVICGHAIASTIDNCVSKGALEGTHNVAGIVVLIQGSTVTNCTNKANLTNNYSKLAGIVNFSQHKGVDHDHKGSLIEGCVNEGTITSTARGENGVGGIIGWIGYGTGGADANAEYAVIIKNCENKGAITGTDTAKAGQIVGSGESYIVDGGNNKGLPTTVSGDNKGYFAYAIVENGVATYVSTLEAGKTYLVTAAGAKPVIELAPCTSITFDASLAAIDTSGITTVTSIETTTEGNATTYTAAAPTNWSQVADTSWYNDTDKSFTITTPEQLAGLAQLVNAGTTFKDKTVILGNDINLSGEKYGTSNVGWPGIGVYSKSDMTKAFCGTFDGADYTVSGVTFADNTNESYAAGDPNNYRGFFNQIGNATVKNLTVSGNGFGENPPSGEYGGAMIVGHAWESTIENCVAEGAIVGNHNVAGIVVRIKDTTIKNCTNKASVTGSYSKMAGIVALSQDSQTGCLIEGCVNEGTLTSTARGENGAGGIIGWIGYPSLGLPGTGSADGITVTIKNCENKGSITGTETALIGQIVGMPNHYWNIPDGNKGRTDILAVGISNPTALYFAIVSDGVATYVTTLEAGNTYLVTANGVKPVTNLAVGETISFDTSLADINASGITTSTEIMTSKNGNVTTYTAAVAKIGDTLYPTLLDAVNAAEAGQTVILLDDIVLDETITIESNDDIILDLNGNTVTVADIAIAFCVEGRFTVTDTGKIETQEGFTGVIFSVESGEIIIGEAVYEMLPDSNTVPDYIAKDNGDGTYTLEHDHSKALKWTKEAATHKAECSVCKITVVEEEPHEWENGVCVECDYICGHEGGTATCEDKAICSICNIAYGELDKENHTEDSFTYTASGLTHDKFHACCGEKAGNEAHTYVNGVCSLCSYTCGHEGGTAYCNAKAICTVCNIAYGELDANNHASNGYTYTDCGLTHAKLHSCCGEREVYEGHTYENGSCACGKAEPEEKDQTACDVIRDIIVISHEIVWRNFALHIINAITSIFG